MQKNITISECLQTIYEQLLVSDVYFGHGTDNAWDEAIYLVFETLNLLYDVDDEVLNRNLDEEELILIQERAHKRIQAYKPTAYLVNKAYFAGLSFYVDERVIIPRSPIAELIQNHFEPWINSESIHKILDIGTGSGCIAIACAHYFPQAKVDAIDLSNDALAVAEQNVQDHGMMTQVKLTHGDCFPEKNPDNIYNVIIANPPYVPKTSYDAIPEEYKHEPRMSLVAEDDGLAIVIHILQNATDYLSDDGILILEVGECQQDLQERYANIPFIWLEFLHDGEGVALLTKQQLLDYEPYFECSYKDTMSDY